MDIFARLTRGAQFDRKRFQREIELFKTPEESAASDKRQGSAPGAEFQVPDFFAPKGSKALEKAGKEAPKLAEVAAVEAPSAEPSDVLLDTPEKVKSFRSENKIRVFGSDIVNPIPSFNGLFER